LREHDIVWLVDLLFVTKNGDSNVVSIEHRWAIPLRDAIVRAGGMTVADEWLHPRHLVAVGLAGAASDQE
jgi:hypothetical protein